MRTYPEVSNALVHPSDASPLAFAVASRDRGSLAMVARAIERRDVLLAFQPIVQTANSARPAFYEGLIRVLDETGRLIPSHDFIGAVETTELGRRLDCLALEMGLTALAEHPTLRLSVNMSARSIGWPEWMRTLTRALARDVDLHRFCSGQVLILGGPLFKGHG